MRSLAIDSSLEGIAGTPDAIIYKPTPNTQVSIPLTQSPLSDRTLYCATKISSNPISADTYARIGNAPLGTTGALHLNTENAESKLLGVRYWSSNGISGVTPTDMFYPLLVPNTLVVGWAALSNSGSVVSGGWNDAIGKSVTFSNIGNGIVSPNLISRYGTGFTNVMVLCYSKYHNLITRTRIVNFLRSLAYV